MAGVRNEFIKEVPELPESSVVINYNEDNEVVSYTVVNKSQGNRPVLIFEPKEFEAYKAGSLSTRGLYLLSPQWSFDIGSAALYADEEKSLGYITDAVTSPEYIFTAITSTMGASAYLGRSSVVTVPKGVDVARSGDKVIHIGKVDDLKNVPQNQTILDELPDLGSPKANWKQNSSVLRKKIHEGYEIRDASKHRLNSSPDPTPLRPDRTVGQSFLGAERNLLKNKGLKPK